MDYGIVPTKWGTIASIARDHPSVANSLPWSVS
jgi:hypothetical protein